MRSAAELLEHRHALLQPAPDGAVFEAATGFAVAGIVEADAGAAVFRRPGIERECLGAHHVRVETGEPEQPRRLAGAGVYRDPAHGATFADLDERG